MAALHCAKSNLLHVEGGDGPLGDDDILRHRAPRRRSCTSETTRKPVYRNETIAVPGRGFDEEDHTASAHHDPGAVSLCPPPHKMTRDGCQ